MPHVNYIRYYVRIYYLHLDIRPRCQRYEFNLSHSKHISTKYLPFEYALFNHDKMTYVCQFNLTKDPIHLLLISCLLRVQ
jgi:hypothetical protein